MGVDMPSFESSAFAKALLDVKRDLISYVRQVKDAASKPVDEIVTDQVFLKYDDVGLPTLVSLKSTATTLPKKEIEDLVRAYLSRHYC